MTFGSEILLRVREKILQSDTAIATVRPLVSLYRTGIHYLEPERTTLPLPTTSDVSFYTETQEEIRHFYPIPGELDNVQDFVAELRPEDVVFDIGAHIGVYTVPAIQRLGHNQVFAFEPFPANAERLQENAALNNFSDANLFEVGLADKSGVKEFSVGISEPGAIGHTDASVLENTIEVEFVRGEDFVNQKGIPFPTVLKIDVEGAELSVLRGLRGVIDECRVVYCEVSESSMQRYGDTPTDLFEFLETRGFDIEVLGGSESTHQDIKFR